LTGASSSGTVCLVVVVVVVDMAATDPEPDLSRSGSRRLISGRRFKVDDDAVDCTEEVKYSNVLFVNCVCV